MRIPIPFFYRHDFIDASRVVQAYDYRVDVLYQDLPTVNGEWVGDLGLHIYNRDTGEARECTNHSGIFDTLVGDYYQVDDVLYQTCHDGEYSWGYLASRLDRTVIGDETPHMGAHFRRHLVYDIESLVAAYSDPDRDFYQQSWRHPEFTGDIRTLTPATPSRNVMMVEVADLYQNAVVINNQIAVPAPGIKIYNSPLADGAMYLSPTGYVRPDPRYLFDIDALKAQDDFTQDTQQKLDRIQSMSSFPLDQLLRLTQKAPTP